MKPLTSSDSNTRYAQTELVRHNFGVVEVPQIVLLEDMSISSTNIIFNNFDRINRRQCVELLIVTVII